MILPEGRAPFRAFSSSGRAMTTPQRPPTADAPTQYQTSATAPGATSRPRCRLAMDGGSGTRFRGELGQLLHNRLRVVALIALCPLVVFLIRSAFYQPHDSPVTPAGRALHAAVVLLLAGLTALLWLCPSLSMRALRAVELTLFG